VSAHARRRGATRRLNPSRSLSAAAVLVVGLVLSWSFASVTIRENALARNIDALKTDISAEQARNTQLQASAAEKQSTDYIVEKAKQLGWVWPWEALIAVQRGSASGTGATSQGERPSRIARWITLFVGVK
jgi:cell division protein FtsB